MQFCLQEEVSVYLLPSLFLSLTYNCSLIKNYHPKCSRLTSSIGSEEAKHDTFVYGK